MKPPDLRKFLVCNYTEHFGRDPWDEIPTTIPEINTPETTVALMPSPCDDKNTFRCPEYSACIPTDNRIGYSCECLDGYKMSGNYCQKLQSEVSDLDCPSDFKDRDILAKRLMEFSVESTETASVRLSPASPIQDDLFKMKVNDLKNPIYFVNDGIALIQVQSQIVSRSGLHEREHVRLKK